MTALQGELLKLVVRDRKRRERRRKLGEVTLDIIAAQIGYVLGALSNGFMLMLAVGVAHAEWIPQLPTIGYWWACLLVYLLHGVFSRAVPKAKDGER